MRALDKLIELAHGPIDLLDLVVGGLAPLALVFCNLPIPLVILNALLEFFTVLVGSHRLFTTTTFAKLLATVVASG